MIKQFLIFKNDQVQGNQPQYRMVAKNEDNNTWIPLASLWIKDKNGLKYYSGEMKSEFTKDDGTKIDGYVILSEQEYKRLTEKKLDAPDDNIDINTIPNF